MGLAGPPPKSRAVRELEGNPAHRDLPGAAPQFALGAPARPKGMTAAARRAWEEYLDRLAPLGILRLVDGFALQRLCEDVAELQELQAGRRKLLAQMKREAKAKNERLAGGAAIALASSQEGRRLALAISQVAGRIYRAELQFGLTPVSSTRLEGAGGGGVIPFPARAAQPNAVEAALCG